MTGIRNKLLLLLVSLLVSGGLAEIGVRLLGNTDRDGNFELLGRRVLPFRYPIERVRALARIAAEGSLLHYDPDTGWAPRPGSRSAHGLYRYDEHGIRIGKGMESYGPPGERARILLLGDSFVHGDDVPFEDSLGAQLQDMLADKEVEVLNLGVPAFGMDQAVLRFEKLGPRLRPAVVVFGFQAENMWRNLNLVRPFFMWPCHLPFTKPRFVLEGDALHLVNHPALRPERLLDVLRDFESWPLWRYESFYAPRAYHESPWQWSRALAALVTKLDLVENVQNGTVAPAAEELRLEHELAVRIIERLGEAVRREGARLVILHVPRHLHVKRHLAGTRLAHAPVLTRLAESYDLVDPLPAFAASADRDGLGNLFIGEGRLGHYTRTGNGIAAAALAGYLRTRLR